MSSNSHAWLVGKWASLLSMATWIAPPALFTVVSRSASASPDELSPEAQQAIIDSLEPWAQTIITETSHDIPDTVFSLQDFTGDGVPDDVWVYPGSRFQGNGVITVSDGATSRRLYQLVAPPQELCFAHNVALLADCNFDGIPEIAVASGVPVMGGYQMIIRLLSGADGVLVGTLRRADPELGISDEVEIAGDLNGDHVIDLDDVVAAAAAIGAPATTRVDLDVDGQITSTDVVLVASKVEAARSGAGVALCGSTSLAPPAAIACAIAWCCQFAAFLSSLITWLTSCWTTTPIPGGMSVALDLVTLLGDICTVGLGIVTSWPALLQRLEKFIEHIFRVM